MKQNLKKFSLAASAFVFAGLFSFGWSAHSGLSLVDKAEARVGRPLTPVSVAGVARRQNRRAVVGTAAAVGAAGSYYAGAGYASGAPYHHGTVRGARAAYYGGYASADSIPSGLPNYPARAYHADGPWYGYSGWDDYALRNGIKCTPGSLVKLDDAQMYICQ